MEHVARSDSTSSTSRSKHPFDGPRSAARGSVEAMPHPVWVARPHDIVSRILRFHKEEQNEGTELQKEKFIEAKRLTSACIE
jgi:hypothetical protein